VDDAGRGRLVAFEGIDGCGKSTQAELLARRLGAVLTFEPGATLLGSSLRSLLLDRGPAPVGERTEALLMAADRAQHLDEVVGPALASGSWVVSERFSASTLAYQGFGRGLARPGLELLIGWATDGLWPDVTVLIDVPVEVAASRRRGAGEDRFEAQGAAFLQRVADGYHLLAGEATTPWLVVDGTAPVEEVADAVWTGLQARVDRGPDDAT